MTTGSEPSSAAHAGDAPDLIVTREGGVLCLTLNRPARLNALTTDLIGTLQEAIRMAEGAEDVRSVLLTGAGRGFCAGQDLGKRDPDGPDWPPDLRASVETHYAPLIDGILSLPKPVICAVNGVAAGAGANLALACDIVLAARGATFIQSFSRVGLIPDAAGTWVLPRLIGLARARALCLTGDPLDADTAEAWGMIWKCVPPEALMAEATQIAQKLGAGPTVALGMTKRALRMSSANTLEAHFALEADSQARAGETADYEEGVRAFLARRAAVFKGR